MVPRSLIWKECYPGHVDDEMCPVTTRPYGQSPFCGSESVISASPVSINIAVVPQSIPVMPDSFPELVSILKRVSSNYEIFRSNTASPIEVVSDSSGYSLKLRTKIVNIGVLIGAVTKRSVLFLDLVMKE